MTVGVWSGMTVGVERDDGGKAKSRLPFVTNEKISLCYSDFSDLKIFCVASYPRQVLPGTASGKGTQKNSNMENG